MLNTSRNSSNDTASCGDQAQTRAPSSGPPSPEVGGRVSPPARTRSAVCETCVGGGYHPKFLRAGERPPAYR